MLTENEYKEKVQALNEKIVLEQIKETEEYKKLKDLCDKGILSSVEFENKLKILKR